MLKEKVVNFERKHKLVPKAFAVVSSGALALTGTAIVSSAEGTTSTVDISAVTESMTTNLSDLVSKAATACAGVVGIALTIFGLKWVIRQIISFFCHITH